MTTPITRARFLKTLAGLAAAPYVVSRALAAAKPAPPTLDDLTFTTVPLKSEIHRIKRAIKVPSNRYLVEDMDSIVREGYHPGHNVYHAYAGDWDNTFKLEVCDNPAYVYADLVKDLPGAPWPAFGRDIYDWGRFCDELVYDCETDRLNPRWVGGTDDPGYWKPRHTVASLTRATDEFHLRHHLRMHFLVWQSFDPRYQRSWPVEA